MTPQNKASQYVLKHKFTFLIKMQTINPATGLLVLCFSAALTVHYSAQV